MRSFGSPGFSGIYACLSTLLPCFAVMGVANVLQDTDDSTSICHNFTEGLLEKQEFYSPNYPNNYPQKIKCERVIEAPIGKVVKLNFLDKFDVEPSENCKHDRLEVRDGRHGFDPLFFNTSWCGHKFPEIIQSTQRFLWLRFVTDETIEYTGFKAVYTFVPRKDEKKGSANCTFFETSTEGFIGSESLTTDVISQAESTGSLDCIWSISVHKESFISVVFLGFELAVPNDCNENKLQIFAEYPEDSNRKELYCGTSAKNLTYKFSRIYVRLKSVHSKFHRSKFLMHYTAIRQISADASCNEVTEFDCKDMSCIDAALRCNGNKNCKYNVDEEECTVTETEVFLLKENVMGILTIGMILLLSIWISMVISCYREWKLLKERENELATRRSMPGGLNRITVIGGGGGGGTTDDHGCYVPEVDLSVFHIKRFNGGMPYEHRDRDSARSNSSTPPPPPPPTHAARTSTLKTYLDEEEETGHAVDDRPRSFESTNSAPDVIGRH